MFFSIAKSQTRSTISLCLILASISVFSTACGKKDSNDKGEAEETAAPWKDPKVIMKETNYVSDTEQTSLESTFDSKEYTLKNKNKTVTRLIFYVTKTGLHYTSVTYSDVADPTSKDKEGSILFYTVKFLKDAKGNTYMKATSGSIWTVLGYTEARDKLVMYYGNQATDTFQKADPLTSIDWGRNFYLQYYK